jgi:hypothetical protein
MCGYVLSLLIKSLRSIGSSDNQADRNVLIRAADTIDHGGRCPRGLAAVRVDGS